MEKNIYTNFKNSLQGDLFTDLKQRILYSTDASAYQEIPIAVVIPKSNEDIQKTILFAKKNNLSVIPRGAGTSLAGQVTGPGIVVDVSKYLNQIIEINIKENWVLVEPGVILSDLNKILKAYNLQFAPETSTANRCCIGGMLGNNSCGLHSLVYGSVREHVIEIKAFLSDGTEIYLKPLSKDEFYLKCNDDPKKLETKIYRQIEQVLSNPFNREQIKNEFPAPEVKRRNNGYAIDLLMDTEPFTDTSERFNFCKLIAGSEGTLAFVYQIKLNLTLLPPVNKGMVCAHFNSLEEALDGNILALKHNPVAIELMDDIILKCTEKNIEQSKNRFFIKENPKALLLIEFNKDSEKEIEVVAKKLETNFRNAGLGYHFPLVKGEEKINRVWALRKAGLGVLSNISGDKRNVTVIEDTAVNPLKLPEYISEFKDILKKYGLNCVFHAHIATGELHLRPLLNLKDSKDVEIYSSIAKDIALLVKKFRGSLSGEHGDGRLRGEFIPLMLGEHNYNLIKNLKYTWDPDNLFNPGKIVDTPPITNHLKYNINHFQDDIETFFDFSENKGYLRSVEKCSGSGDCRKNQNAGGTMCPTFMATLDEDKSTRARANLLREYFSKGNVKEAFSKKEIYEILDLCISCKACKSECPSSVDMAKLKAEFLQHYYDIHRIPLRSMLIAYLPRLNRLAILLQPISNYLLRSTIFKILLGISSKRSIPGLSKITLNKWYGNKTKIEGSKSMGTVYLFNDEFTNFNESEIGIKAILLLSRLGYNVKIPVHKESARTYLSKGLVRKAKKIANTNVSLLGNLISQNNPLIGLEPSAILAFRVEYPDLVDNQLKDIAIQLSKNSYLFEEFFCREIEKGHIQKDLFVSEKKEILLHGHCQQKAVASTEPTKKMLSFPENYSVKEIPSGCCGMAGSFGYEKEHYELSMKIGEMVLFPKVRDIKEDVEISAPGTSCRHHIFDGTGKKAKHPVEIMYEALIK